MSGLRQISNGDRAIFRIITAEAEQNCYIIERGDSVLVIDPGCEAEEILGIVGDRELAGILFTHHHADHRFAFTQGYVQPNGTPLIAGPEDPALFDDLKLHKQIACDCDLQLRPFTIQVLQTPGHTAGSVCYRIGNHVFTGDTLFKGDVGWWHLPGGSKDALLHSVKEILFKLPDDTEVHPGHGDQTTIGHEKEHNKLEPSV